MKRKLGPLTLSIEGPFPPPKFSDLRFALPIEVKRTPENELEVRINPFFVADKRFDDELQ